VTGVGWSRWGADDCLVIAGVAADATVEVRPRTSLAAVEAPPMAGRVLRQGDDICFIPRFPFVEGTAYAVIIDDVLTTVAVRPQLDRVATTEVLDIRPSAEEVPRNLLRFYLCFSAPMAEGCAAERVRLVDESGDPVVGALLPVEQELWDPARRRLTVLLDPARIKRGLVGQRLAGYPLRPRMSLRLVVDQGFLDARGVPLRAGSDQRYRVGSDERRRVEPEAWSLGMPTSHTLEPLEVSFGRSLDYGLLSDCIAVIDPDGRAVRGAATIGPDERSWLLAPQQPWAPGAHRLVVDPVLEDLAGNSVARVFDRDLTRREDEPRADGAVVMPFRPV
jgi:hypothetical protein